MLRVRVTVCFGPFSPVSTAVTAALVGVKITGVKTELGPFVGAITVGAIVGVGYGTGGTLYWGITEKVGFGVGLADALLVGVADGDPDGWTEGVDETLPDGVGRGGTAY